jgi:hypothetical protein
MERDEGSCEANPKGGLPSREPQLVGHPDSYQADPFLSLDLWPEEWLQGRQNFPHGLPKGIRGTRPASNRPLEDPEPLLGLERFRNPDFRLF